MKQIVCEMCGSKDLLKQDGVFVCQSCGTKYTVEEARKLMIEGTVDVTGSTVKVDNTANVEKYLRNAHRALEKEDWEEVEKYYNLVEQNETDNMEAVFFSSYGKAMLSLMDSDYFKREQKFKVLNHSISVISDYYETTKEDKEAILRLISTYVRKMAGYNFVYQRQGVSAAGAIRAASGVTGSRLWCESLMNSTKTAFITELRQILEKHDDVFVREILSDMLGSTAETQATVVLQTLSEKLYTFGSPAIISSGTLSKLILSGKTSLKLTLDKVDSRPLESFSLFIAAFDEDGNAIGEPAEKICALGGANEEIPMPNGTQKIVLSGAHALYKDGIEWTAGEEWSPLPEQENAADYYNDADVLEQYQKDFGKRAKYICRGHKDLWFCACGSVNKVGAERCSCCGSKKTALLAASTDALKKEIDDAKAEAERKAEEKRLAEEAQARKTKKILSIVLPIAAVLIAALLLTTKVFIPNSRYNKAVKMYGSGQYEEAVLAFEAMDGYKDSAEQATECAYLAAAALKDAGKYDEAIAAFEAMNGYKDSAEQVAECAYRTAIALKDAGRYAEALTAFKAMDGYKESAELITAILASKEYRSQAGIGDIILFGTYEQDNNTSNGRELIEWRILAKENGQLLLISEHGLDAVPYNTKKENTTWEQCTLRTWLNDIFLKEAFTTEEQAMIATTNVTADKNPEYNTNPGGATSDKVFLLSHLEAKKYFSSDKDRQTSPTAYAIAQGARTSSDYKTANGAAACRWWLRSPGRSQSYAADVDLVGSLSYRGDYVYSVSVCVRPALWINLAS